MQDITKVFAVFIIYQMLTKLSESEKKGISLMQVMVVLLSTTLAYLKYCSVILHYISKCKLAYKLQITIKMTEVFGSNSECVHLSQERCRAPRCLLDLK